MHEFIPPTLADLGRVLSLPATILFVLVAMWLIHRLRLDEPAQPHNAIDSSNYRAPEHQHLIDFDRSPMLPLEGGAILAQCCMQGCDVTVTIGRTVAELLIEEGSGR